MIGAAQKMRFFLDFSLVSAISKYCAVDKVEWGFNAGRGL